MQLITFLLLAGCQDQNLGVVVTPPLVAIDNPREEDILYEGVPVGMIGVVSDATYDRELDKLTVIWLVNNERVCDDSSLDATGVTICEHGFNKGEARISLSVSNPDGGSDDDTVTVEILANGPPTIRIESPTSDGNYYSDHLVELVALVSDPEDPAEALQVVWTASEPVEWSEQTNPTSDGTAAGSTQLESGEWYITATVTDTAGRTAQDAVTMVVGSPNNAPECAITSPESGSGVAEGRTASFEGTASDKDVPSDMLTADWTSDIDGSLGSSTIPSDGAITFSAGTLSTGAHTITLQVADEVGTTCTDNILFLVGSQPNVSITAPTSGDVANQGDNVLYEATITDLNDDPADIALSWTSSVSGEFNTQSATSTGKVTFTSQILGPGSHTVTLTATDPEGFTGSDTISFTINGLPDPPDVEIEPNPATSSDDLKVTIVVPAIDPEGDTISYTYAWYQDGLLTSYASSLVPSSATTRGQTWKVEVTPDDGLGTGDPGSDTVTIENSVPTLSLVQLTPDPAGVEDALSCTPVGSSDADGDTISLAYTWQVNGSGITETSDTLSGAFVSGDDVVCIVTPADSLDVGSPVTSNTVTIGNSAPSVDSVTLIPTDPVLESTLTCTPNGSADADGDSVSFTYGWEVNALVIAATTDTLAAPDFSTGDQVQCIVTPTDGTDSGTPVPSNTVTIENTAPSLDSAGLSPDPAYEADTVVCTPGTGTDADGDTVSYTYTWTLNGGGISATSNSLTGADFDKSDELVCIVTPTDGTDDGDPVSSDPLTISNTPPTIASAAISPTAPVASDLLSVSVSGWSDDDGDTEAYDYQWFVEGAPVSAATLSTFSGSFVRGDVVEVVVTPWDGEDSGTPLTSSAVTIENAAPEIASVTLTPTDPQVVDTLTCTANGGSDEDGDSVSYAYAWEVDGLTLSSTSETLASPDFAAGHTVACVVTPNDGTDDGAPVTSNTVTIENTAPEIEGVTLSPDPAYESDSVVCTPGSASDADGDSVSYAYAWTLDGGSLSATSANLTGSDFDKGDTLICTITPNDGSDDGSSVSSDPLTISNSPPSISSASITPANPGADETLAVTIAGWSDDDGDSEGYGYQWYVNGSLESGATSSTLSGAFVRDDVIQVVVTPDDGEDTGTPMTSSSVTIANAPPEVASATLSPSDPQIADTLTCTANGGSDADGDSVSYGYGWEVDGLTLSSTGETLAAPDFAAGETVLCIVTPTDGTDDGSAVSSNTVTIQNTAPVLDSASLSPNPAYESDSVACSPGSSSDADGDSLTYSYAWTLNGGDISATSNSLTGTDFDKGDALICLVTPNDGTEDGASVSSGSLTISNTAPSISSAAISPSSPSVDDTLSVSVSGWSDDDGDSESHTYQWSVNGTSESGATSSTFSGAFVRDDVVSIEVTPWDGEDYGSSVVSSNVTIQNSMPSVSSVSLTPTSGDESTTFACSDNGTSDGDGDSVSLTYGWVVNGVTNSESGTTLTGSDFDKGDTVACTITPDDGTDSGATVSSNTVTIDNTPPELASATLTPDPAYQADTLSCTAGSTSDADGETVGLTYSWDVSGSTLSVTSTTLTGSYFAKSDAVSCTITPNDGDDDGTSLTSNTITISNSAPSATSVSISPSTALADDTLTASATGWGDPDGDSEAYLYQWYVNGSDVSGATSNSLTGAFSKGDSVTVEAWPWDGADAGSSVTSTALVIGNTPPTDPAVVISPASPQPDDDLSCTLSTSSSDSDGDSISYSYSWELNGTATSHSTSLVAASDTAHGETWTCCATASDGTDSSATVCASDTVSDTDSPGDPTISDVDEYRNEDSVTLSGSCEDGCTLVFYLTDSSGSWTETAGCGSANSFSHSVSLTRGDITTAFVTCEDTAGNVSGSSNSVSTEVCDPEDIFDSSTFTSGYGDTYSSPVDYWATLPDDGSTTITIDGNIVATADEDWFVIHTDDSSYGATGGATTMYDFAATVIDGTGVYTIVVYQDSVSSGTQECSSDYPDGYDEFSLTDDRASCGTTSTDYNCSDQDLGYDWYIEVVRDSSVSPSCQGYTLEITNG
jgi:hypothetical protein